MTNETLICECAEWARDGREPIMFEHHRDCAKYDPLGEARRVMDGLIAGIEAWAADEDGVHPACWNAYERACMMTGRPVKETCDGE